MTPIRGTIIYRTWGAEGLHESTAEFATLDDLFAFCLNSSGSGMIDRVILTGTDDSGAPRTITFSFSTITAGNH